MEPHILKKNPLCNLRLFIYFDIKLGQIVPNDQIRNLVVNDVDFKMNKTDSITEQYPNA